jgi:hypothetical protein
MPNLPKASLPALPAHKQIRQTKDSQELSLYSDNLPSPQGIAVQIARLKVAFPKMERHFFDILAERIVDNDFTEKRLEEAVNHIIDNFQYKELNVADIIKFDKQVKLYTGNEFVNAQMNGIHYSKFQKREIDGVRFWILKEDLIKAGLK